MSVDREQVVAAYARDAFALLMETINLCGKDDGIRCDVARAVIRLIWERLLSPQFRVD